VGQRSPATAAPVAATRIKAAQVGDNAARRRQSETSLCRAGAKPAPGRNDGPVGYGVAPERHRQWPGTRLKQPEDGRGEAAEAWGGDALARGPGRRCDAGRRSGRTTSAGGPRPWPRCVSGQTLTCQWCRTLIWNPSTLDRIWLNSMSVSEHGTDMSVHVYTSS
jgi:hypothetical protein